MERKPGIGKMFAAALFNALGKGVEGYGEGQKSYREYALKQLQEERAAKPTLQKDMEYLLGKDEIDKLTPEQKYAKGLEISRAGRPEVTPYNRAPTGNEELAGALARIDAAQKAGGTGSASDIGIVNARKVPIPEPPARPVPTTPAGFGSLGGTKIKKGKALRY